MIPKRIFEQSILRYFDCIRDHLNDPEVSEVMVNGADEVWVEKGGELYKTDAKFDTKDDLMGGVKNIAQYVGKPLDKFNPRLDARLPDGSRVHVVLDHCCHEGVVVSIRRFSEEDLTVDMLLDFGSITPIMAKFIEACVKLKRNIVVAGGTGSGKTSLLNVVSNFISDSARILVIEDSTELQLQQEHVLRMEARNADSKGRGEVSIGDLFHSAMRLRPDRIVIGEIRGGESLTLLQAMTSGHGGTLTTCHATYPDDTLRRLETMAMMSDVEMPLHALRSQVASAIQIIIQTSRFNDGSRKVTHISEALDLNEAGEYTLNHLFKFKHEGTAEDGTVQGKHVACGNVPTFMHLAESQGIELKESWFEPENEEDVI